VTLANPRPGPPDLLLWLVSTNDVLNSLPEVAFRAHFLVLIGGSAERAQYRVPQVRKDTDLILETLNNFLVDDHLIPSDIDLLLETLNKFVVD
jgi:hypothetical protein